MYFVEPIVCLFVIRYLNMYVYSLFIRRYLFAKIFAKLFLQHNLYPAQLSICQTFCLVENIYISNLITFFAILQCMMS